MAHMSGKEYFTTSLAERVLINYWAGARLAQNHDLRVICICLFNIFEK